MTSSDVSTFNGQSVEFYYITLISNESVQNNLRMRDFKEIKEDSFIQLQRMMHYETTDAVACLLLCKCKTTTLTIQTCIVLQIAGPKLYQSFLCHKSLQFQKFNCSK